MPPTCAKEVFLPALVGTAFPRLLELKRLGAALFSNKRGENIPTFFGEFIPRSASERLVNMLLIQFL